MTPPAVSGRFFLVGCPRSGTTLVQVLVAAHPQIASFPESHFFAHLQARHWLKRRLRIASRGARVHLDWFLRQVGGGVSASLPLVFIGQYARAFVGALDRITVSLGKTLWVEKTPDHLHHMRLITDLVPGARFLHVIRAGTDVVASLYDVTHRYPEVWGRPLSLEECARRWVDDVRLSLECRGHADHLLVRYERVVDEPRRELERIFGFMGVGFDPTVLTEYRRAAGRMVLPGETWKASAAEAIRRTAGRKFRILFTDEEQQCVARLVSAVRIDDFEELRWP